MIERLQRTLVMVEIARNGMPEPNPPQTFLGPMVTLIDEFSASDDDIFPFRFRAMGLGKLIGKRTWGGVVGIRDTLPLADGGVLNRPEFAPYSKDGKEWVIESHGVDPDIVVDNDPAKEFRGEDQQLDRAIQEIQARSKDKALRSSTHSALPESHPRKGKLAHSHSVVEAAHRVTCGRAIARARSSRLGRSAAEGAACFETNAPAGGVSQQRHAATSALGIIIS